MSQPQKYPPLTLEILRSFPGMEVYSDSELEEIRNSLQELANLLFLQYQDEQLYTSPHKQAA